MWKQGWTGSDKRPLHYKRSSRGTLHVAHSTVKLGMWRWDATQAQTAAIVPDTHHLSGLSPTLKDAKAAAEHALAHMLKTNAI